MNLVFYSPQFLPSVGGLQNVVHYWAESLTKIGHQITVITQTPNTEKDAFLYPVIRSGNWFKTWQAMRRSDAVLMFNLSLKALPIWLLSVKPLIISHHTSLGNGALPWQQALKGWLANHLAKVNIACSRFIAHQYKHCLVLHSPYDANTYKPLGLKRAQNSLLFVGRLVSDKGVDILIESMAVLNQKGVKYRLGIIGDGLEKNRLEKLAENLGDSVQFFGSLKPQQVAEQLNLHEQLLVPSRVEPFGIVVLEGLACGCRVLFADNGGLKEAGGGFAQKVAENNAGAWAAAIRQNIEALQKIDDGVLAHFLKQNTVQASAETLEKILQQKLSSTGKNS